MTTHDVTEWADERLEHEIATFASRLWAATARWIDLLGEFDRRERWLSWGCRSAGEWLSWQCGVAPRTARDQVRVARALRELPVLKAAFAEGGLSYAKVRALIRIATPATEADLVGLARRTTAAQLESLLTTYSRTQRRDGDDADTFAQRFLRFHHEDDGTVEFRIRVPADLGARASAAIDAGAERLCQDDRAVAAAAAESGSAEPHPARSAEQRRADAFVELVTTGTIGDGRLDLDVHVEVDASTLVSGSDGTCSLNGGVPLTLEIAQLLACDAAITALAMGPNDEVLDVGRRRRTTPRRIRRALERRDRNACVVDGCPRRGDLHAHHVVYWSDGGPTKLDNLVLLCSFHHRLVHLGELSVELVDGKPTCHRSGHLPRQRLTPLPMDTDDITEELTRLGVPTELANCSGDGERMDLGCAIDGLNSLYGTHG